MNRIFATRNDFALALARLILGIVFFLHGAQLVLGWFGGRPFPASLSMFVQGMHIPTFFAGAAIWSEFLGGIGLIVGFLSRFAALGIAIDMLVAIFKIHIHNGFFMNWYGNKKAKATSTTCSCSPSACCSW